MTPEWFESWLAHAALAEVGIVLIAAMGAAIAVGIGLRSVRDRLVARDGSHAQEGYIVSAVLGLMALLLGFTFSLAVDRYDARRARVVESANAIGTPYLRAQLLPEPHRSRLSSVLVRYTDNVIVLAKAQPGQNAALLAEDDRLLTEIWAATAAGFDSVRGLDFSSTLLESANQVIDMDAARRAARQAHVPGEVFGVLFVYFVVTAGVMSHVLTGFGGRMAAGFLLVLMVLSLLLILDIDRPTLGGIRESQGPMEAVRASMAATPPGTFDRWRTPAAAAP